MKQSISILGSTGSVGTSVLNIIDKKKKNFSLKLLSTNKNYSLIYKQLIKYKPKIVVIIDQKRLGDITQVFANTKKLNRLLKFKPKYNNIKKILLTSINWEKKYQFKKKKIT